MSDISQALFAEESLKANNLFYATGKYKVLEPTRKKGLLHRKPYNLKFITFSMFF